MEQLLERQWEQGSQFLMEQGQHFDSEDVSEPFICIMMLALNLAKRLTIVYCLDPM